MNELLTNLVRLQSLELNETSDKNAEALIAGLRAQVPAQILGHYDRLMVRGKKGITAVRNQTCTGCHMRLPIAVISTLMHDADLQLCDNCGRYLYLPEEPAPAPTPPTPEVKPKAKTKQPRKKKAAAKTA